MAAHDDTHLVPLPVAFRYWLRLGFINFGGPAGQIAIMHEELVEKKKWIGNERFLHALNYCMLLPGPEAQQLAIYVGWLLNGTIGGIVAGVLFVLPAAVLILALSWTFVTHGDVGWVAAVFFGLKSAVIALVVAAVIRVGSKALKNGLAVSIAAGAFVSIFFFKVAFPLIVVGAASIGLIGYLFKRDLFPVSVSDPAARSAGSLIGDTQAARADTGWKRATTTLAIGLAVWWGPLLVVLALRGTDDTLSKEALFFSQAAMVTFGGAYAVLSYIDQAAVQHFGWLRPGEMATGLGLAESTPGPLIMVTQFVGFVAAYRFPGGLDPLVAGTLGAAVTVWATFAPCFLWIFLGAPFIERLRGNRALAAGLTSITAAVVGVILNLAATFAIFALFDSVTQGSISFVDFPSPQWGSVDLVAAAIAAAAFVCLWRFRLNVLWVVLGSAVIGLIFRGI